jgi:hypothetical protein
MVHPVKLNVFQRGILQKIASASIYLTSFPTMVFFLVGIEKRKFIEVAEKAQEKGILSPESFHGLKELIVAMDGTASFDIFIVIFLGAVLCLLLMRWTANSNLSWPVVLPKAVEFRSAMRMLNIMDTAGEIECVRRHKLSVFIASASLSNDEQEKVRAQLYAFARHMLFKNDVFERYIGKKTLCLDAGEYESVVEKIKNEEAVRESVTIAEQNDKIKGLQKTLVSLTQENENLTKKCDELSGKVRIQPAVVIQT